MISSPSEVSRIDLNFSLITKVKYGCFVIGVKVKIIARFGRFYKEVGGLLGDCLTVKN